MTKFEEEFKALTSWDWINIDLIQQILTRFGNWHSDGEFQELLSKYSGLNHNYEKEVIRSSKLESQIVNLKSQLQQQALPVVPECVAVAIEKDKQANISISDVFEATFSYENHHLTEAGLWTKNNPEKYIIARNIGYTVEKPQLFYLKHIDMSKRNSINDLYLKKYTHADLTETGEHRLSHTMSAKGIYPPKEYCAFTQQEIDSMQTGSYEQIEVVE